MCSFFNLHYLSLPNLFVIKIFSPKIKVGVIAFNCVEYDLKKWWPSSEGMILVILETISYFYGKLVMIFINN